MNIPSPRGKRRARIEIIPLIDIMFFLLATFVMVSLSMVKQKGISVNLPGAATATAQDDSAVLSISAAGRLFLNKREIPAGELPAELARMKSANPDVRISINGDEHAHLGQAISVLDELRKAGITRIAFQTRPLARQ